MSGTTKVLQLTASKLSVSTECPIDGTHKWLADKLHVFNTFNYEHDILLHHRPLFVFCS